MITEDHSIACCSGLPLEAPSKLSLMKPSKGGVQIEGLL
jgi:hypothetical protein